MSQTAVVRIRSRKSRFYILRLALVTALSGLLFGFDTAVINGALVYLRQQMKMTTWQTEMLASSLLVGAILGAALGGRLSDAYGRRRMLSLSALIFAGSSVGAAISLTLTQLSLARFAGGIAIGAGSVLAPLYLAEIAPAEQRGRIVTINQLAIVSGMLISYFVNWLLAASGPSNWRWMFGIGVIPSFALWIGLFFVPESPRWMIQRGLHAQAETVIASLTSPEEAKKELEEVQEAVQEELAARGSSSARPMRLPLLIAITLAVLSQVTGINTVLYYGAIIFQERFPHQTVGASLAANILVGIVNLLGTIAALRYIDKLGRRFLLLFASAGMAVSLFCMAYCFYSNQPNLVLVIVSVLSYIAFFAFGMAPAMWAYISEIFPNVARGSAVSMATVSMWSATLVVTLSFLSITQHLGVSGAFLIYAGFSVASFVFVWKMAPETRGKTLEQVQQLWPSSATTP